MVEESWARLEQSGMPFRAAMRLLGDPIWKLQYEALVLSAKSPKDAQALLDNMASKGPSPVKKWAESVRTLLREDSPEAAATRRALAEFDLAKLDSARYGAPAPDFELTDLVGKTWKLSQFKGKKAVALVFLGHAG
jgi:hypothetical protein